MNKIIKIIKAIFIWFFEKDLFKFNWKTFRTVCEIVIDDAANCMNNTNGTVASFTQVILNYFDITCATSNENLFDAKIFTNFSFNLVVIIQLKILIAFPLEMRMHYDSIGWCWSWEWC